MASNVCNLLEALVDAMSSEPCITDLTCHGDIDPKTGRPRIAIFESRPNVVAETPSVGIEILNLGPLAADCPLGCYKTDVLIYAMAEDSCTSAKLADAIQSFFHSPPFGVSRQRWCRDISNDCITSKSVRLMDRLRQGREGINNTDHETEVWYSRIIIEVLWCECNCEGED